MRQFVLRESLRHLWQAARNLIQNSAEERVRLLCFGRNVDGAQKGIGGIVESAQPVIGHAQSQFELSAPRQPRHGFFENDDGLTELLLVKQRFGSLKIELDRVFANIGLFWNFRRIFRSRLSRL